MSVTAALAAAIVAILALSAAYLVTRHELNAELDLSLRRAATNVARQVDAGTWVHAGECLWLASPGCVQLVAADGTVTPEPDANQPAVAPGARDVATGDRAAFYRDSTLDGHPVRSYIAPVSGGGAVQVSVRADSVDRGLARIGVALGLTGAAGVLLAALLGYLVARTSLRPVAELTRTAETIAATRDPAHRIDVRGDDELARLGASVNTMLDELDAALRAQRRLVADASHELRTPLTSLRAGLDLLARGELPPERAVRLAESLRVQGVELTGLVNDLIELARGDDGERHVEDVRLDALVEHCVDTARRHWPGVEFTVAVEATVVDGVPERLARAVANLLDNAAKFAGSGHVRVGLDGGVLRIADDGPGIAEGELPRVFDRFWRAPSARGLPGSGLGLAIVRQVVEAHGGVVTVESKEGEGTVVTVALPANRTT
ncbi:sensor histidine kinase [Phytomonospora endophytica]|uniref:histidine kinase n=1 Tax=Phytomonospora endophytica TaxID=714109 RepID=A0A841FBB5_9ACTN|nr:HAMP domain-containing sensor histidine kinase [Phytomonospora endophytica]MBB6032605.1 two-component system sensor histidine kinase MprB [Phytomonospora endophytica]GIG66245.1 two-component sensor histidine kinase [Phytomonospora endophytica]